MVGGGRCGEIWIIVYLFTDWKSKVYAGLHLL